MKKNTWIISLAFMTLFAVRAVAIPIDNQGSSLSNIDPKNAPEYVLYKAAQKKYASGDLNGAKKDYLKSLEANPIFFPSMIGMADIEDRAGNKQKAENYFKKAFGVAKDSALLHAAYGKFLFKYNDIPGAKKEFERALEINPKQSDANVELAVIYLSRLNKPRKAIERYQQAIEGNPKNISLQYGLSTAQAKAGDINGSIATLKSVAKKLPGNALPWQYMGIQYAGAGRFNDAINMLKTSLKKDPELIKTHWILGDVYVQAKQYSNALKEFQWIIDNTNQKAIAYLKQGLVHQINRDYRNAQAAYIKASKANPKLPESYNNLAYITLETKKDYKKGLEWAKKAVSLKPDSSVFLDTLGWIYYQIGDYQNARQQLQIAVKSKPVSAEANYHLGKVYEKLNDKSAAAKYFSEARKIEKHFKPVN